MKIKKIAACAATILITILGTTALSADLTVVKRPEQAAFLQKAGSDSKTVAQGFSQKNLSEARNSEKEKLRPKEGQSLDGNSNGGGGVAYKLPDGTAMTLPEFGLLFKDDIAPVTTGKVYARPPTYCEISKEVWEQYHLIEEKVHSVFPSFSIPGTFNPSQKQLICKMDVNPEIYEQIKREYRLVLEAFGYELEADKMILPAYSENGITYILPDYNLLNDSQKAKYLIHESNMRDIFGSGTQLDRLQTLERALKIDTLIQHLAFPKPNESLDIMNVLQRMAKLKVINEPRIFDHIMLMLVGELQQLGQELRMQDFTENGDLYEDLKLDPSWIQELQIRHKLKFNYAEMLEGSVIRYEGGQHYIENFVTRYCSQDGKRHPRIIADPTREIYLASKHYKFFGRQPAARVKLTTCDGSFGTSLQLADVSLRIAGPFIKKLSSK